MTCRVSQVSRELRTYRLYGVSISSELPLPFPEPRGCIEPELSKVEIRLSSESISNTLRPGATLQRSPFSGFYFSQMLDASSYVRWDDVGEVLISKDGELITCHPFPQTESESFHVYLLGQALSFALVNKGFEPVHASAVAVGDQAIAFLGDCGLGKSTLAAAFLQAGHRLLTDDLLLLQTRTQSIVAFPGPGRIKLFPKVAGKFLADASSGVPLNPKTQKQIIPLNNSQVSSEAMPLAAAYVLASPNKAHDNSVRITALTEKEAFINLLSNTFNRVIVDPDRLRRHFDAAQALANIMPIRKLSYPRSLEHLPLVREAILSDLYVDESEIAACTS
jgi:hypothetical protein